jgi:DUF971 family protein
MAVTPTQLRQMGKSMLGIEWNDGHNSIYHVRNLRLACKCASCVDEWTREKKLDEKNISLDVVPKNIESVGAYALQFQWSDNHSTGIYPYTILRELCECPLCKNRS